ncbi:hypothetical protein QH494_16165 [Sphingomonas sp. AR_OL41]|uniref:hypothetical protein n=1 Tax=Sphingomonas sp. AR_OL41 TaxID=3042729 RepID=UPI0024805B28|nr:hypothetical protein [Sphingomonas sp. AR_OL41]MDH7973728.1 hypothetical protein [Sphingomonas sp. AR_OL41]
MSNTLDRPRTTLVRWIATVHYRTAGGLVDVQHDLEEIEELQNLVEQGPHWDTIERIDIVRADGCERQLTVEEAAQL